MRDQSADEKYLAIGYYSNPEVQQSRCRICYLTTKPLIKICQCAGSIEYVHEQCVIEWITKKIEVTQILEIPKCQLCQRQYYAQLFIGKRRVSPEILLGKVKQLPKMQLVQSVIYLIGSIVALWVLLATFASQVFFLLEIFIPNYTFSLEELVNVRSIFTDFVFPIVFLKSCLVFFKKFEYLWLDSYVQMVELILSPIVIIKE